MEEWMLAHMEGVLIAVEILWVAGFLAVFVIYFLIQRRLRKQRGQTPPS